MIPYHTPAELRQFSNLGHVVEGILLGAVALVTLVQAFDCFRTGRARYVLPGLLIAAGLFLPALLLVHPTLEIIWAHARITLGDLQQKQHFAMALLLLGSGVAETFAIRRRQPWLRAVWPIALILIGLLFLVHPQHGTDEAMRVAGLIHRWLGLLCIAAGAMVLLSLHVTKVRWPRVVGSVLLFVTAALLIAYREPPGAYENQSSRTKSSDHMDKGA